MPSRLSSKAYTGAVNYLADQKVTYPQSFYGPHPFFTYGKAVPIGLFNTPIYMTSEFFTRPEVRDVYMDNEVEFRKQMYGSLLVPQIKRYQHVLNPRYIL